MNWKDNIPPFYIGQKVVCTDSSGHDDVLTYKGEYVVHSITRTPCCGQWVVNVGVEQPKGLICSGCLYLMGFNNMFRSSRFRPLQSRRFPLIKLSEIKEKEREEVLCDN